MKKKPERNRPVTLITYLFIFLLFCSCANWKIALAQEKSPIFNKDASFDIYYEVSKSKVSCVENVKIAGIVMIENTAFLHIKGPDFSAKEKDGFILFSIIKAILPTGIIKPKKGAIVGLAGE